MSATPPSPPSDGSPAGHEPHQDPLAADRRTLVVAAVAMVGLVLIGVVSASLFTRSACEMLEPEMLPTPVAGTSPADVLASTFEGADSQTLDAMEGVVTAMSGDFGPLTGVADVPGADHLTEAPGSVVAVGETVSRLNASGNAVTAASDVADGTVVGNGSTLYSLAIGNELTGQVDALLPLDAGLVPGTCVDTAVVGTAFAFHLDAGDGQLLLFRSEEDASAPELELRDGAAGRLWAQGIELETAPPGVLAERLDGRLMPQLALVTNRTSPGDEYPVVTAVDRMTGMIVWTLDRDDLAAVLGDEGPQRIDVIAADDELAIIDVRPDDAEAAESVGAVTVAIDVDEGAVAWFQEAATAGERLDALIEPSGSVITVARRGDGIVVERLDRNGRATLHVEPGAQKGWLTGLQGGNTMLVTEQGAVTIGSGTSFDFGPLRATDVAMAGGATTWLFHGPEDGAVAVTFGG